MICFCPSIHYTFMLLVFSFVSLRCSINKCKMFELNNRFSFKNNFNDYLHFGNITYESASTSHVNVKT